MFYGLSDMLIMTAKEGGCIMKFDSEKKAAIIQCILSKIASGKTGISRSVADAFGISTGTVHVYLNELIKQNVITKNGRDSYSLTSEKTSYVFTRSKGEMESEDEVFDKTLSPVIRDLPENVKKIWMYSFSEMVNNTIDHSDAEHLFIVIQKNCVSVNVVIADDGIGIFRKIQNHFGYKTIDDAIIELSKGKLTTDSVHHSGEGIFFTSRIMDEFLLYSDKKVFSFNKFQECSFSDIEKEFSFSTLVNLSLSNSSKKQIADVFDEYSDVDNGFIKTRIPLKNIFESSPVSRSQAKRLGNRLEQFKEVEIDFDGIDFIGQGFAHEIFFVFANAHPDIKLTPLNMNEDVQKMYRHVTVSKK